MNPASGYFVGVDIRRTFLNIGLINFKGEVMELRMNVPYLFENTPAALDELCSIVSSFIAEQGKLRARWNKYYLGGDPYFGAYATMP